MITLFTTTKDFTGKNRVNQLNAIRSWLSASCSPEVIIFGKSAGIEEIGNYPNLKIVDQVKTSGSGAPFANEMFNVVAQTAGHKVCCYINADILLTNDFFRTVQEVLLKVKRNFLLVGQRTDVDVADIIDLSPGWEEAFYDKHCNGFKLHLPSGSDYFIFPKGQYHSGNMPPLLIGRPGWDLWMIYNARKRKLKTIDLSPAICPYHQNHDYSHKPGPFKPLEEDEEAMLNLKEIPEPHRLSFTLVACNYAYKDKRIQRVFSRGDVNNYVVIEKALGHYSFLTPADIKWQHLIQRAYNSIFLKLLFASQRKFNIGAARFGYEKGWLHTDIDSLNITRGQDWKTYLKFLKLDYIAAEHVWEHLTDKDTEEANKNCFYFLKGGGSLRIAVPDGYNPDKNYIEHVRQGGSGPGAYDHKVLYNYKIMSDRLQKAGFIVRLLEYWDENGVFHSVDWSDEGGHIMRSKRYDPRNQAGKVNYTSLIVDAVKPKKFFNF